MSNELERVISEHIEIVRTFTSVIKESVEWHKSHSQLATKHDLEKLEKIIMSALSDLQAAVTALQTSVANESSAVLAAIADIKSLPASDAALVPLTSAIASAATTTQANADSLNAAIAPATPTPTPAPAPAPTA
jgi:hypothetical protein